MTQFHWALDANRTDDHEDILAKEIKATSDETVSSKLVSKSSFSSFRSDELLPIIEGSYDLHVGNLQELQD